jgi:hypothetical protein
VQCQSLIGRRPLALVGDRRCIERRVFAALLSAQRVFDSLNLRLARPLRFPLPCLPLQAFRINTLKHNARSETVSSRWYIMPLDTD